MLLLLMLNGVLAEAGYHYDVPDVAFHLPGQQPANFRSGASSSVDFNKGSSQALLSNPGSNANSGISASVSDSSNYGHAHTLSPVGFTVNTGYTQTLTRPVNLNNHYASRATVGGNDNSYQAGIGTNNFNNGDASTSYNYNTNDLSQTSENSANSYNAFPQTLLPPLESNLNSDVKQPTEQNFNNLPSGAVNTNNGPTQTFSAADAVVSNAASAPPVPAIIKHIYFHVPPPDIEEQAATPFIPPAKKTYKILFIKLPAHERSNTARLQQLIQSQNGGVEEKTLIYVLVKKPDGQQSVVVPERRKPNHEVFFVKYNGNAGDIATQINGGFEQTNSAEAS